MSLPSQPRDGVGTGMVTMLAIDKRYGICGVAVRRVLLETADVAQWTPVTLSVCSCNENLLCVHLMTSSSRHTRVQERLCFHSRPLMLGHQVI